MDKDFLDEKVIEQFQFTTELRRKDAAIQKLQDNLTSLNAGAKVLTVAAFLLGLFIGSIV